MKSCISFKWVWIPVTGKGPTSQFCPGTRGETLPKGARALHRTHVCELSPCLRHHLFGWCIVTCPWKVGLLLQWGNCLRLWGNVKGWECLFVAPHPRLIAVMKMTPILPLLTWEGGRNFPSQAFEGISLVLVLDVGDFSFSGKPIGLCRAWRPKAGSHISEFGDLEFNNDVIP